MNRIRELRLQRRLTQAELARLLGTSDLTVRRWEGGTSVPQRRFRVSLARRLGVKVDELGLDVDKHEGASE